MRDDKKGISIVVVSLIMVIIVLGAVSIVWLIVNDIVGGSSEQINLGTKCLEVDVKATKLDCTTPGVCDVTIERNPGGDAIGGVKLIFTNATGGANFVSDSSGDITELATKTVSAVTTGIANVNKVEVAVYFTDASGNEELCTATSSFSP